MKEEIEALQLSVRSTNCLKQEQIYYIEELVIVFERDLMRLPNMGIKSLDEIKKKLSEYGLSLGMDSTDIKINASQNTNNANNKNLSIKKESEINIWLDSIANIELKQAKLNNFLLCAIDNLTARSRNALNSELILHNNIIEFLKCLFSLKSILILPNIGKTSELEIQTFLTNIYQEVKKLFQSEKTAINTAIDLMESMNIPQHLIDEYVENNTDNDIHFFAIINLVVKSGLSKKELEILKYRKDYWDKSQITLECLGKKVGVTRERIRQIEEKTDKKLWSIIKGLSAYFALLNIEKLYDFSGNFIGDIAFINKQDKTCFSDNFLYKTLAIFLKNDQLIIKNNNKYRFLIKKSLADVFNFKGFVDKISSLIEEANTDYKLDFNGVLCTYLKPTNSDINMIEIKSICEELLNLEFNMVLDIDNQILIKGSNKKPIKVYAEEVLSKNNRPMHLDEIYNELQKMDLKIDISKRYISNSFVGNDKFIFFDRNSTYGLKSWEGELTKNSNLIQIVKPNKTNNERSGIKVWSENGRIIVKGGTIINIVIEYLKQFKEPKHINEIFSEVVKWRDTNKFKLGSNLKANNRGHFVFYKNSLVGLANE